MKYTYTGETIEQFNAWPLWLIKGHEYQMIGQSRVQKQMGVAYFRDESGDQRQIPLEVMKVCRYTADDLCDDRPFVDVNKLKEFVRKHNKPVDELSCQELISR